ncbi:MAG: hypothetical protein IJ730_03635 [Alphaproteobacteria bacterium]|nr:hypothetical protein [Alphaproteobacteria bacterium]
MKKLFITLSTFAAMTYCFANASDNIDYKENRTHIAITDDVINFNKNDGQILESSPLFSEGSLAKSTLDKIVEVNDKINKWIEEYPSLINFAKYTIIIGGLLLIIPAFIINPIATSISLAASLIIYGIVQLIAKGKEYLIDYLVEEKGYSEEDVNKYVCAIFELGEKLLTIANFAYIARNTVTIAKKELETFSRIKIKKLVAKRFSLSYKIKRQYKNFIKKLTIFWNNYGLSNLFAV